MIWVAVVSLLIAVCSLTLYWQATRRQRAFLQYIEDFLTAVRNGRYHMRLRAFGGKAGEGVIEAANKMTDVIGEKVEQLSHERDVLNHILHTMTTGVAYIGRRGAVQMVNEAAEQLFRRPAEQWLNREHWAVFRQYRLCVAIDNALLFGVPWHAELVLHDDLPVEFQLIPMELQAEEKPDGTAGFEVLMLCNDVSEWRRVDRMRSAFIANVSHELKTPITAIHGFAETLLDGDVDAESQRMFLQTIYDESGRMGHLVSDLLELSKLEGHVAAVQPKSVYLRAVVERAAYRLQGEARRHDVELELRPIPELTVWADDDKLLQVLLNLIANAIHYTPDGGKVTVWCDVLVDRVKVHVEDTGIGIEQDHLDHVFERFYRVDKARSRSSGGTGLGLAIVKHIIQAHGGQVGVNSEYGKGSDFWFTLSRLEGTLRVESMERKEPKEP